MLWFSLVLASVPTPGAAVLHATFADEANVPLAAEPEAPVSQTDEEKVLEQDMAKAHEHMQAEENPPGRAPKDPKKIKRRSRGTRDEVMPGVPRPTLNGRYKSYYLAWGIADWAAAGGIWLGSVGLALNGAILFTVADKMDSTGHYRVNGRTYSGDERTFRAGGWASLGLAAVGGAVGALLAVKASDNLEDYRTLKAQERELLHAHDAEPPAPAAPEDPALLL